MQPGNEVNDQRAGRSFIESARRAQIVRAAIDTIADVGFGKASFARIAERAGISASLISYHFAAKGDLIEQVVRDVDAEMDRALTERAEGAETYLTALRALIEGFVHYCAEHPAEMLAVGRIHNATRGDEPSGRRVAEYDASLQELIDMLREGQEAGEFRDFSPRYMAVTITAAFQGVPGELFAKPDTDVAAYADELATTFEHAVRRAMRGRRKNG
ncbi:MAG: TetR family transcriptional regulator [Streptosporangiales bacterium]|nr:TetR family transcriptional regulator [Streptosporangiales bacterium]